MRKFLVSGASLFLLLCLVAGAAAQTRSVYWQQWDVLINNVNTSENRFDVTESYNVQFTGTFSFGAASIPNQNLTSISNIRVLEAGQPLTESCSQRPGTYCIENNGSEYALTYYFMKPITNANRNFEIQYTVRGALRVYSGGDQLWWTAIPSEHYGFTIGSSTVTVQLPDGFGPREGVDPVVTYGAPTNVNVFRTTVTATTTRSIGGSENLEIRVQYPHDPNATPPAWQPSFDEQRLYEETTKPLIDLGAIALSVLIGLGGILGVYALWRTRGRDPQIGPVPEYLTEPPGDLPPAIVGTLLDEQADLRDVLSTIIDLAHRGYLVMEEEQSAGLFGIGKNSTFTFKRTDKGLSGLRKFEQRMMQSLFPSNKMERSLESLKNKFYTVIPRLQDELYESLVDENLFTAKPSTTRAIWSGLGTLILVAAGVIGFAVFSTMEESIGAIICIPISLGLVGFVTMISGQHMPAKTRKGAEDAAKWNAFRKYLQNLEKYSGVEEAAHNFDAFLPYAVAFGIDRAWIRKFSQMQNVPIPTWYYPTYMGGPYRGGYHAGTPLPQNIGMSGGGLPGDLARAGSGGLSLDDLSGGLSGGLESISTGLTSMLESASRVMTSKPQSASSGSSGSWRSGGSGWSGGGFSGGGSSGGGSRGFG
ncbi:MAG: DUF2207 domain-containing protein [Anaerolineaceae bacterium]|nr:DUF2207 domain-containing protein [Anaerolineaceae bacterium]